MPYSNNFVANRFLSCKVFAADYIKINSINFDNSDSIIFLGTSTPLKTNENGTIIETQPEVKITKKALTEPDRVFFDIENAIITFPNSTYELKNSRLQQLKIAQFSTEPNTVRIVIWNSADYDASQIKVLNMQNNIIIKLSNEVPLQHYLSQIYRETKESAVEFYEKAVAVQEQTVVTEQPRTIQEADEIFNQVQKAFKEDDSEIVRPNIEQRQAKLKSRFFLEQVVPKNGNILLSGVGVINVEKPFVLQEPSRLVFDLPNTIVAQELRDKEILLSETESVKIGQFEPSKARIVIKTDSTQLYKPIYSTNLQTLLIANENRLSGVNLVSSLSELSYFKEQSVNQNTDIINIIFSSPIIYSIQRETNRISLVLYNLTNFNTEPFNALAQTNKTGFYAEKLSANSYKISFPVATSTLVDCYETLDATQLRFVFTKKLAVVTEQPKKEPTSAIQTPVRKPEIKRENIFENLLEKQKDKIKKNKKDSDSISKIRKRVIVIDPGHGGADTGAMRGSVLEKDLTLSIAQKVEEELKSLGMKNVVLTRTNDKTLSLQERVDIANGEDADIFVSIHINASVKSEINGIETHYYSENGFKVAEVMHKELMDKIDCSDRGLFKSKFYVINHTEAPAVLLELGFISNDEERNLLLSEKRQRASAQAIADGIVNYLMENKKK